MFALDWKAHGYCYGIGTAIDRRLALGDAVLVNGSRAHAAAALARYPRMFIIAVTVSKQVARALAGESVGDGDQRLRRTHGGLPAL